MLVLCVAIFFCCAALHTIKHCTFAKTKNGLISVRRNDEYGIFPVIFNAYCVAQFVFALYLTIYYAFVSLSDNVQSLNTINFILLYPLSLMHTTATPSSANLIHQHIMYTDHYNILSVENNLSLLANNPLLVTNLTCCILLSLFEGFFNFYRFYGVYNVQRFLAKSSVLHIIRRYAIYSLIFLMLCVANLIFKHVILVLLVTALHATFNIHCEYKQVSMILSHQSMFNLTDDSTLCDRDMDDEYNEILKPLYLCKKINMTATLLSSLYLIGLFGVFTDFYFLIFYPVFFAAITSLQTMSFIKNRLFVTSHVLCFCRKSKHAEYAQHDEKKQIHVNIQTQPDEDDRHHFNSHGGQTEQKHCPETEAEKDQPSVTVTMEDMREFQHNANQHIVAEPHVESVDDNHSQCELAPLEDVEESAEISSLLFAKHTNAPRSPNSVSTQHREDRVAIDENNEVLDVSGLVMTKYLSSPSMPFYASPASKLELEQSVDVLSPQPSCVSDHGEKEHSKNTQLDQIRKNHVMPGPQKSEKHEYGQNKQEMGSAETERQHEYKLETDDLMLTLTILVHSGIMEQNKALQLNSLRKVRLREQQRMKSLDDAQKMQLVRSAPRLPPRGTV